MNRSRSYIELTRYTTIEDRFNYLKLSGTVGQQTFGFDRFLNQQFYHSHPWRKIRDEVILRDNGCEMGLHEWPISGMVVVHHMNPVKVKDFLDGDESILSPEHLICVGHKTHLAIHFGDSSLIPKPLITRKKGDTNLW